jgi:hypothetical protein
MSFLGFRNAVSIGVSPHVTLGGSNLLGRLSPTLILDFVGAQTMDPRITFTRASTATFTGQNGLIQTAAIDAPRFDYNPTTLAPLGLLIEEQRANLFTYSEDFANAAWQPTRASITANTIVAPDGTLTGDKLVEDTTATNTHSVRQNFTVAVGAYTYSVFAKAGERTILQCARNNSNIDLISHVFNLVTGVATGTGASMTSVGNGWYRCVGVITVNTAASTGVLFTLNNGSTITYTGDGFSGLFLWGAQLEAGAFPTSYIQTVASQVTRAADVASMTGTNFSDWYNATEGTAYTEAASLATAYLGAIVGFSDGTINNRLSIRGMTVSNQSTSLGLVSGVTQWSFAFSSQTTAATKFALGYKVNDIAFTRNAATPLTDASALIPVVNQLRIGAEGTGTQGYNGHIRQIVYYPRRLANSELQAITA